MKVYLTNYTPDSGSLNIFVQPGAKHDKFEWLDSEKKPMMLDVRFERGIAEVDEMLAQYLVDEGLAKFSPIMQPFEAIAC